MNSIGGNEFAPNKHEARQEAKRLFNYVNGLFDTFGSQPRPSDNPLTHVEMLGEQYSGESRDALIVVPGLDNPLVINCTKTTVASSSGEVLHEKISLSFGPYGDQTNACDGSTLCWVVEIDGEGDTAAYAVIKGRPKPGDIPPPEVRPENGCYNDYFVGDYGHEFLMQLRPYILSPLAITLKPEDAEPVRDLLATKTEPWEDIRNMIIDSPNYAGWRENRRKHLCSTDRKSVPRRTLRGKLAAYLRRTALSQGGRSPKRIY